MSQPSLVNRPADLKPQKQPYSVYTVMLIVSFFCILTATLLLYFELERWGDYPWWNTNRAAATGGGS